MAAAAQVIKVRCHPLAQGFCDVYLIAFELFESAPTGSFDDASF